MVFGSGSNEAAADPLDKPAGGQDDACYDVIPHPGHDPSLNRQRTVAAEMRGAGKEATNKPKRARPKLSRLFSFFFYPFSFSWFSFIRSFPQLPQVSPKTGFEAPDAQ